MLSLSKRTGTPSTAAAASVGGRLLPPRTTTTTTILVCWLWTLVGFLPTATSTSSSSSSSSGSLPTVYEYSASFCSKGHVMVVEDVGVDVGCVYDDDGSQTRNGLMCYEGQTMTVSGQVYLQEPLPYYYSSFQQTTTSSNQEGDGEQQQQQEDERLYKIEVVLCKTHYSSFNMFCTDSRTIYTDDLCQFLTRQDEDGRSCGSVGTYNFAVEAPFPGKANYVIANGHAFYVEVKIGYETKSGTAMTFERCTLEFTAFSQYNWTWSFLGLSVGLLLSILGFRKRHVLLKTCCHGKDDNDNDNDNEYDNDPTEYQAAGEDSIVVMEPHDSAKRLPHQQQHPQSCPSKDYSLSSCTVPGSQVPFVEMTDQPKTVPIV